jgi:arginyl-tRNA synthetase
VSRYITRRVLREWLSEHIESTSKGALPALWDEKMWVKRAKHGDWASNAALLLAPLWKTAPQEIAAQLTNRLNQEKSTSKATGAAVPWCLEEANGFLNFQLSDEHIAAQIERAQQENDSYGRGTALQNENINVEFVSADPTGPLTLSSARIAAGGEALCRLLEAQGAQVTREFFLNDVENSSTLAHAGRKRRLLLSSRYRSGNDIEQPEDILTDKWVRDVAHELAQRDGDKYLSLPDPKRITSSPMPALEAAVGSQKEALESFGVRFDVWTSEAALHNEGRVQATLDTLKQRGYAHERNGVLWLRTTAFRRLKPTALWCAPTVRRPTSLLTSLIISSSSSVALRA